MESRIETSHGTEVPRKSRSLDLKSLYKPRVKKENENKKLKRKATADDHDESRDKKKKKSVKEVSLSSLKNISSSSKKSLDRVFHSGLSSGLPDSKDLKLERNQKLNGSIGFNGISPLSLDDNVIQVPRRKRGFVGRKKLEGGQVLKQQGQSCIKVNLVDQKCNLSGDDSGSQVESWMVKRKNGFDDFKENRSSESNSARRAEVEDGLVNHLVVNNGNLSKSRKKRSKAKNLAPDSKGGMKEAEPLVDNSLTVRNNSQEDDEENLEENAAMMLSSRFDPNCTGFSSNNKATASPSVDGFSFLLSSGHDFVSGRSKSLSGSESPSNDTAARVLRPRKQHKEKGHSRKRRHFYEVFFGDLDANWVLNRRIKVFWPLDQSWYYGLVNDYDKERKLHHVKYDDRDEEWINLQNERFKLLLLPSEVPGKAERRKSTSLDRSSDQRRRSLKPKKDKEKREFPTQDESCIGSSYLDSEPIISWLARSTRRVKSPFHAVKKQKTSDLSRKLVPPPLLSKDAVNLRGSFENVSVKRDKRKISRSFDLIDRHTDDAMKEDSASESVTCHKDSKMPIVYVRRRFRKTGLELSSRFEENHLCRSAFVPVTSLAPFTDEDFEKRVLFCGSLDQVGPLWSVDDAGMLKLMLPEIEPWKFKFDIDFPVVSFLYDSLGLENFWLFHAAMLLHYGTVMITWPQVHLEMLFVDNIVGLRFLLFEGCLKQVLAFVFLVLTTFHQPTEHEKFVELQLPVTSIRFKLTCLQRLKKQLVFAFYNFSELENSKWIYLDWKLKRHCSLTKQLPLSECTYDNIQMLQNRTNHSSFTSLRAQPSLTKVNRKRSRQGISFMGISRDSAFMDISRSSHSDEIYKKLPPLALSFTAAPTFFLGLHLKLLMEQCLAHFSFREHDSVEHLENSGSMTVDDCSSMEECSNKGSEFILEDNMKTLSGEVASDGCFFSARQEPGTGPSVCSNGDRIESSQPYLNGDANVTGTAATVALQAWQGQHLESDQCALSSRTLVDKDKSETGSQSLLNGLSVEIPAFNQLEKSPVGDLLGTQQSTELSWNTNGGIFPSPNPTAPRSTGHRNKHSTSFGYPSHSWSDGKADLVYNGFGNGPRKPRTQVSYSLPFGGYDFSPKQKSIQKGLPPKRIRKANEKRSSDVSKGSQRNLELLSCDVNILVTAGDRGWRVCGALVVLEHFDHNEWKLAVKVSGVTKYSYKAHQFLQPGSTNRYTHAMMWKGGKDWILEFQDRSQWALFKEIHEECYNRNIRAASMKSIPIPGVRLIEEGDDSGTEIAFLRSSSKYIRQVEADVEMALNPSRVLYDMDTDDEQWILNTQNSSEFDGVSSSGKISEEMFEKIMDTFEKVAYAQQRDQLTSDEIEELMAGVGPMDIIKVIYEHWRQKRKKNGMPLIRHLQPPLWERYQKQVREWELAMTKVNASTPNGFHEKVELLEKPPMFAFCMKPRGLEVPNKGSKQRSHRKASVAGQSGATFVDQDGYHAFGRRLNGFSFGDEKFVFPGHGYDSLDDSPLPQTSSPRIFSPRDAGSMSMTNDGFDGNHIHRFHRRKSKKFGTIVSPNDPQMMALYDHRMVGNRNGLHQWNMGSSEWQSQPYFHPERSQRHIIEQFDGSDLDEFRLRDASRAAQHAIKMAKRKREKAQRMVYRADVAIHKAVAALMTAEAIDEFSENSDDDG
ncbi:Enhancer of polycomb-like [Trema orientale]|uniref:Enhancer of polycomb-like protein n=1 Tax=Trema orientale TaxID=63057 RepID=A0A2P5G232_TREOI|nr:Enhancer of polycomb-like [Trema orientale]